ncbi:SDR family oxidoreductase [Streptomyces sp. TRM66268-LWL]|uniref:SDR family oxidoreductase n=2 Tax=Streptomyces polyasparticus TaxID=2767826 RepID=A0ABR7STW0_9ACTN|nr:SDR family oxidoreductase [Streptomyces polyasparticus]
MPASVPTLVTGAASGTGRHIAAVLATRGAPVAAVDLDAVGLAEASADSPSITPWVCDLSDEAGVHDTVKRAEEQIGPIQRVIHCAGIAPIGRLLTVPTADIERVMSVNYLGTVHVARATVPSMIDSGRGAFTVIASIAGWIPMADIGAYSASKAAVISFCEALAAECRRTGVRIVCVCPAAVETPMLKALRRSRPDIVNDNPGIPPAAVLAAAERALDKGKLYAFPGRGNTTLWRARRLAPLALSGVLEAAVKRQRTRRPPGGGG